MSAEQTPAVPFDELVSKERVAWDRMTDGMVFRSTGVSADELMRLAVSAERWVYENKCVRDCEYFIADAPARPARCPFFKADRKGRRTCSGYRKDETARIIRDLRARKEQAELFQRDLAYYRAHGGLPPRY